MQKQKTIAKWLIIILLCTVAVGAYIIYDAVFVEDGGRASAGESAEETPTDGESDNGSGEEVREPVYTTLPRGAQTIAGVTIGHAGGEGEETLLESVFTSSGTLVFFSSTSLEYDCRGTGIYLAYFDSAGTLQSVARIADDSAVFGGAKLTSDGVVALTSTATAGSLQLFSLSGELKGETDFPASVSAHIMTASGGTLIFYNDGNALRCATLTSGFVLAQSTFLLAGSDIKVCSAIETASSITLILQDGETLRVVDFSQNSGFNSKLSYDKAEFMQIVPIAGESETEFVMLTKDSDGLSLFAFTASYQVVSECAIKGASEGALFGDGVSVTLIRSGAVETYCRHLDLISSSTTALTFGDVVYTRAAGESKIFAALSDGTLNVYRMDGVTFTTMLRCACTATSQKLAGAVSGSSLLLALSPTTNEGIFFENFGGGDLFLLTLPLSA